MYQSFIDWVNVFKKNNKKFKICNIQPPPLPFLQNIDSLFQRLIPDSHQKQLNRANEKPHLKIPGTCFSTVTINRNFRTALHQDAGDFKEGFGGSGGGFIN